jgi:transcriptional regulator GlxA family with amidase domain
MDRLWAASGSARLLALLELLDCLARDRDRRPMASQGYAPAVSHRDSQRLTRVLQYINDHIADEVSLSDIARIAGLSAQAFGRFFRKKVGMSCIDYVIAQRISLACRHLLETDQTIATVAFLVGFNNLSNFNRQFRRLKGVSPKTYRHQGQDGG